MGMRKQPRANVVWTEIRDGNSRPKDPVQTVTPAPAPAMPVTWCHAVVQILSAPIRKGKL
jgi:hypothetical protein